MKTPPRSLPRTLVAAALGAACVFTLADTAQAKDKGHVPKVKGKSPVVKKIAVVETGKSNRGASAFAPGRSGNLPPGHGGVPPGQLKKAYNGSGATIQNSAVALQRYLAVPRSNYALNLADGFAGRGYYYGPRDMPYYYEGPNVRYYRDRNLAPREYWNEGSRYDRGNSLDAQVQAALARQGYYHGPIDGDLGRGSRDAIARYQADRGLRVTGGIDGSLLASLGLR